MRELVGRGDRKFKILLLTDSMTCSVFFCFVFCFCFFFVFFPPQNVCVSLMG